MSISIVFINKEGCETGMDDTIEKMNKKNYLIHKVFSFLKSSKNTDYEKNALELQTIKEERIKLYKKNLEEHYTVLLHIEKPKEQAFYLTIKNMSTYEAAFDHLCAEITQISYKLTNYVIGKKHLPEDIQKSINHLIKYLEMFQRRLETNKKLNDSNFNSTRDYREAAREKLSDLFRSSLISKCMQAIADGFQVDSKKQYYIEVVKIFNSFLKGLGIYTILFTVYDEIDFELLIPESKTTTDNPELNGRIADLYMLPYFFNDPDYNGHALISEGICVAYSAQ